jgi:hypothetical protein
LILSFPCHNPLKLSGNQDTQRVNVSSRDEGNFTTESSQNAGACFCVSSEVMHKSRG